MALSSINAVCTNCNLKFKGEPKRSFLGFQKLSCPNCLEKLTYPLTSGYRTTYRVLFIFMVLSFMILISEGGFVYPGGFGIAIIFALIRDRSIKKQVHSFEPKIPSSKGVTLPKVESIVNHEASKEIVTNNNNSVSENMESASLSNKKTMVKVFKIIGWMSIAICILLISLLGYQHYTKLQIEKDELIFKSGGKWEWHDKNNRIQINNVTGQSILRKVNLQKRYVIYAIKNKDFSLSAVVDFDVDCQPNTEITTSQKFDDGSPKKLRCKEDGNTLSYEVLWSGKNTDFIWKEDLDGFGFEENFGDWDFTKLDQEITLSKSK